MLVVTSVSLAHLPAFGGAPAAAIAATLTPPGSSTGTLPTLCTGPGFRGRVIGPTGDWPGSADDGRPYARVGSIRVPQAWRVAGYPQRNSEGIPLPLTADRSGGRATGRSVRVYPPTPVKQPR